MREITFRGKRIDNGEWVEGFYWASLDPCSKETRWRGHFIHNGVNITEPWKIYPETVGQYTGLKDKNGKKIFEGDIIVTDSMSEYAGSVEWFCGSFLIGGEDMHIDTDGYNIVGNIHDNPTLLEDK